MDLNDGKGFKSTDIKKLDSYTPKTKVEVKMDFDSCTDANLKKLPDYTVTIKKKDDGSEEATWSNDYKTAIDRW